MADPFPEPETIGDVGENEDVRRVVCGSDPLVGGLEDTAKGEVGEGMKMKFPFPFPTLFGSPLLRISLVFEPPLILRLCEW
jgi:hypothetical protein